MPSLISPGVFTQEIDLTTIVPTVSTTECALAGVFRWGPIDQRVLVDSEVEMVKRFGKPSNLNAETWLTGASTLGYGNRLILSRAANTSGVSPSVTATVSSGNSTVILSSGNTAELTAGLILVSSSNSGISPGAVIQSVVNSTAFTIIDEDDAIASKTNDSLLFISNTSFSAIANTAAVSNLEYQIVKNEDHFTTKYGTFDTDTKFVARFPGEMGNSLRVSVCGNSAGYSSTINLASFGTYTNFDIEVNSNTTVVSVPGANIAVASANATALKDLLNVTDLIEVGNSVLGVQYLKITGLSASSNVGSNNAAIAITTTSGNTLSTTSDTSDLAAGMIVTSGNSGVLGLTVNNVINSTAFHFTSAATSSTSANSATFSPVAKFTISFEDQLKLSTDYSFNGGSSVNTVNRFWEFFNLVDTAPGQSDYVINFGNSAINSDEMHFVVVDDGGKFSGVPGTVLETYRNVSRATDAKTIDGGANHWKDVINDASLYIYAVNDISGAASTSAELLGNSTLDMVSFQLGLGRDGKDETNIELSVLTHAYDMFKSKEDVEVSLILQGKARSFQLANYLIDNIAEYRQDCIVLVSPQKGDVVNNVGNETDAIVNFRNNLRSTSWAVIDSGYKYMYDRYNDTYRWVPLNGDIAGLCVRTDTTNDAWWSPGGFNRGQIKNLVRLAYNPRQADRDTLYKAGINPVVTFPGRGTILFGDKTLLARPSAFDRINVRRLFIVLRKAISKASEYTLFEFNDAFTRAQFRNLVVPYLRDIQGRRGIQDFKVVCDESNNTPEVIDRNEFIGDIYVKPSRSINYIKLNFIAVRSGVAFSEVIGQFG